MLQDEFVSLVTDGIHWKVRASHMEALRELLRADFVRILDDPRFHLVKTLHNRMVLTTDSECGDLSETLFVKVYKYPNWSDVPKYWFCKSRGMTEWEVSNEALRRGVPTILPLAVGERREFGIVRENYLFTKELPDSLQLDQYIVNNREPWDGSLRKSVLTRDSARHLAKFVRMVHDRGIVQFDFHAGNVLVQQLNGQEPRLFLADLHNARARTRLSLRQRLRNLVRLNMAFSITVTRSQRLRFFKEYIKDDPRLERGYRRYARQIERRTARALQHSWRRRHKRSMSLDRHFCRVTVGDLRGVVSRVYDTKAFHDLLKDMDRIFDEKEKRLGLDDRVRNSSIAFATVKIGEEERELFLKRCNLKKKLNPLKDIFRGSRARRAWRMGHGLCVRNIPTPYPLAMLERRRWGLVTRSYLVTPACNDAEPVNIFLHLIAEMGDSPHYRRMRRRLVEYLARLVEELHDINVYHRDLKPDNFLVQNIGGGNFQVVLTDMDSVRIKRRLSERARARNLTQMARAFCEIPAFALRDDGGTTRLAGQPSRTDMLRFLLDYLGTNSCSDPRVVKYWKQISRRLRRYSRETS